MALIIRSPLVKDTKIGTAMVLILVVAIILVILFWGGPIIRRVGLSTTSTTVLSSPSGSGESKDIPY